MRHSFAEPVFQTRIRWHIRAVGDEGPHPNGGIPADTKALCDLSLAGGWDIPSEITAQVVAQLLRRNADARTLDENAVCARCANTYLAELDGQR